jgi:O-antigen/teichoic acid export membrane protein
MDESYVDAWRYIPAIVMVFAIKIPYYFYVNILFYYKEASRLLFIATFSGSVLNIFLSFLLIPAVGVFGSILADAVAMVIRVMIIIFISRKYEDTGICISIFFRKLIKIALFIFCGLVFSYWKFSSSFNILNFAYKILIVGFYLAILYLQNKREFVGFKKLLKLKK